MFFFCLFFFILVYFHLIFFFKSEVELLGEMVG